MLFRGMFIDTDHPEELDIITFDKISKWEYPVYIGFQYDDITNDQINTALNSQLLDNVDPNIDWEDDTYLDNYNELDGLMKHAFRVAAIIKALKNGGLVKPVSIDITGKQDCCSCVSNGHHRIRALQYQLFDFFPAYCSGYVDEIKKIRMKNFNYKKYTSRC